MHLYSLSTAVPPHRFTQKECWEILSASHLPRSLKQRSVEILRKVLLGDCGIEARHFATTDFTSLFDSDAEALHKSFAREAPLLAEKAVRKALDQAGLAPKDLDGLFLCTCTGYLCPGLSSYVAERLGMAPGAWLDDSVGLGCGAAIPMLRNAQVFARAHPKARIACVAVEICSAAFYLDDDPGVLISACLFADGAAAAIVGGEPPEGCPAPRFDDFRSLHLPEHRESLRFENRGGKLRNRLTKSVPDTAARAVAELFAGRNGHQISQIVAHPGGRDVLTAIEQEVPGYRLVESAAILREFGNMSSPSVLFALAERLKLPVPREPEELWLTSFGAGFSCHSCRVTIG